MSTFEDLFTADPFDFFLTSLTEQVGARKVKEDEKQHVATILAYYAQTSRYSFSMPVPTETSRDASLSMPAPADLSEVFDQFVWQAVSMEEPEILETGGNQTLFLNGFFRDQMRRRHNVNWYDEIGESLYSQAAQLSREKSKRELLGRMSYSFRPWAITCQKMSQAFQRNQDDHLILKL